MSTGPNPSSTANATSPERILTMATKYTKPAPAPMAVGDTIALTAFTAANPTVATCDGADAAKVILGETLTLSGIAAPNDALNGQSGVVNNISGNDFTLDGLDLSAIDTTGMTATGTVSADPTAPGTWVGGPTTVPNPAAPLGAALPASLQNPPTLPSMPPEWAEAMANAPADIAARAARTTVVGAAGPDAQGPLTTFAPDPDYATDASTTTTNAAHQESAGTTSPQGA